MVLVTEWCVRAPEDEDIQQYRARLLARTAALDSDDPVLANFFDDHVSDEQADIARGLLARLTDRGRLYRLRDEVEAYISDRPHLAEKREEFLTEFRDSVVEYADLGQFDDVPTELLGLASERFWLMESEDDSLDSTPLGRLASDPGTDPVTAAAARDWLGHVRYGLWSGDWPDPSESWSRGLWVTDLVSRRRVYAVFAPEQLEGLARWTVLAGPLAPVAGVWQSGQSLLGLEPQQADEAVENVLSMAEVVMRAIVRDKGLRPPGPARRPGPARPHGVLSDLLDPMEPAEADFVSKVTGSCLPHLAGAAEASRRRSPAVHNMDGDPIELITATFPIREPADLRRRLLVHPDFRAGSDEPAEEVSAFTWLGRMMTPEEARTNRDQARALARQNGWGPVEDDDGQPQRWVNGMVRFEGDAVKVQTNSQARFETISKRLRTMGAGEPLDLRRIDPVQDLSLQGRPMVGRSSGPDADAAWMDSWIDTKVPALEGATPRQAAQHPRRVVLLEALIRHFEHGAAVAARAGESALDLTPLRERLGLRDGPPLVDDPGSLFR